VYSGVTRKETIEAQEKLTGSLAAFKKCRAVSIYTHTSNTNKTSNILSSLAIHPSQGNSS